MSAFDHPGELGAHLSDAAKAWNLTLGDVDARGIELFGRLDAVARNWAALCRQVLTPVGLNYAELTTLGILRTTESEPRRSPTVLRGLVGQTSAGMTRILDKLEREGLVKRELLKEDGRRVDIVLTRRGIRVVEDAYRRLLDLQNRVSESLTTVRSKETMAALDSLLIGFAKISKESEEDSRGRNS